MVPDVRVSVCLSVCDHPGHVKASEFRADISHIYFQRHVKKIKAPTDQIGAPEFFTLLDPLAHLLPPQPLLVAVGRLINRTINSAGCTSVCLCVCV